MGIRGPAPKRSDQLHGHRSKADADRVEIVPGAAASAPELDLADCHPLAVALYEALKKSPESRFFTSAVWQRARVNAWVLSSTLRPQGGKPISAMMYAAIQSDWKSLLVDPAEQRRLGIEVQAAADVDPDEVAAEADVLDIRSRLGG